MDFLQIITLLVVAMTLLNLVLRIKLWQKRGLQDKTDLFYITSYVLMCVGLVNLAFVDKTIPNWLSFGCFALAFLAVAIGLVLFISRQTLRTPTYRAKPRNVLR